MKGLMAALVLAFVVVSGMAAEPKTMKLVFRDYGVTDTQGVGALSVGACSWTDSKSDLTGGVYWDFKFISLWEEKVNFGVGMCFIPSRADELCDMRLETSVTTHLFNCLELGAWMAPWWDLYGDKKDDPFGMMVGYYFKF